MKTNKMSFLVAGGLLILSAVFSQMLSKDLAQVLLLGFSGLGFTILGFTKQGRKQVACEAKMLRNKPLKSIAFILSFTLVFGGLGFIFGQLLYRIIK